MSSTSTDAQETRVGHCRADSVDVNIGRNRADDTIKHMGNTEIGDPGWLGNPYVMESSAKPIHYRQSDIVVVPDRQTACERFMQDLLDRVDSDPTFRKALYHRVQGKILGCWCQSLSDEGPACHGEHIARVADAVCPPDQ